MTNALALWLALALAALLALDAAPGLGGALVAARQGLRLVEWLAVWR